MQHRSIFISLDGVDGTGKSTQCHLLAEWFRNKGFETCECVDPGGTAVGQLLRQILLDNRQDISLECEMFLFMASRAQLTEQIIRPALAQEKVVICDRFLLANVVYQGHAGGMPVDLLWSIGATATRSLLPDLTIVLDLPLEQANQRRKKTSDRMESKGQQFFQKVRTGFQTEVARNSQSMVLVDASPGIEQVHQKICQVISDFQAQHKPKALV